MPVAQSPAHYIISSKGCPSITESFLLCYLLVHKRSLSPLVRHCQWCNPIKLCFLGVYILGTLLSSTFRAAAEKEVNLDTIKKSFSRPSSFLHPMENVGRLNSQSQLLRAILSLERRVFNKRNLPFVPPDLRFLLRFSLRIKIRRWLRTHSATQYVSKFST
jgi:hypothetical protein